MAGLVDRKRWGVVAGVAAVGLLLGLAGSLLGCGGDDAAIQDMPVSTTATASATTAYMGAQDERDAFASGAPVPPGEGSTGVAGSFENVSLDRKVISNAALLIEVEQGKFQLMFDKARGFADKFGGYIISSNSSATGEDKAARSGTIVLRVPEAVFQQAITDAGTLGAVKSQNIDSQDVTEEYVDLEARLKNAEAQERAYLSLMDKAKTVDEILTVRQVLSQTQQEIEQLKGRIRFLDEHTSFSTITLSIYEVGTSVSNGGWGFVDAIKKAVHAFVDSISAIMVFFGGALPVLALLAFLAWIAYKVIWPLVWRVTHGGRRQPPGFGGYGHGPAAPPYDPSRTGGYPGGPPVGGVAPEEPGPAGPPSQV
ncbi:MAG: DUF4349 domain-containing protein [Thermoleophilia bacterium]